MNTSNSSFESKQMVLVSRHNTDFYEVYDHHCTLLEIDELGTTPFLLYSFRDRTSEILSACERHELLTKGNLTLTKTVEHKGQPCDKDVFEFSVINVFVSEGQVFARQEDLIWKGILTKKTEAHHIIRIEKTDNALATESKSSD